MRESTQVGSFVLVGSSANVQRIAYVGKRASGDAHTTNDVLMVGEVRLARLAAVNFVAAEVGIIC